MSEYEMDYPSICEEVGLGCVECTTSSARDLAKVCKGLRGKALAQMFVQIYSSPACAQMHANFSAAYQDASIEVPRKPILPELGQVIAAVA
jgi:hypothetical protein